MAFSVGRLDSHGWAGRMENNQPPPVMITHTLPGMDVSGFETWGQLCWCPLRGAMKTWLDWLLPRECLASHSAVCGRSTLCQTENSIITFSRELWLFNFFCLRNLSFPLCLNRYKCGVRNADDIGAFVKYGSFRDYNLAPTYWPCYDISPWSPPSSLVLTAFSSRLF